MQEYFLLFRAGGYFSSVDLKSGYFQLGVKYQSRKFTAFICKARLYEFLRFPFGLTTAPASFMRVMENVQNLFGIFSMLWHFGILAKNIKARI